MLPYRIFYGFIGAGIVYVAMVKLIKFLNEAGNKETCRLYYLLRHNINELLKLFTLSCYKHNYIIS